MLQASSLEVVLAWMNAWVAAPVAVPQSVMAGGTGTLLNADDFSERGLRRKDEHEVTPSIARPGSAAGPVKTMIVPLWLLVSPASPLSLQAAIKTTAPPAISTRLAKITYHADREDSCKRGGAGRRLATHREWCGQHIFG